mgnify:CR=1 FL=1
MKDKRVLYVSSEVVPYLPETEISSMSFEAPRMVNKQGGQIRIFMPRYGNINERRHQLHEVIRLSGINLVINDLDMPLIIKVASIPKERIQVYFIDNEEYFKRKATFTDENGTLFEDNDERAIFFAKGVIETVKKLNWAPDIIHVHGWLASLLPLYLKQYYKDEPLFKESKIVTSIYNQSFDKTLNMGMVDKIKFDEIEESVVVGQSFDNDIRIVLFVKMNMNFDLTDELTQKIKSSIKKNCSPSHVPSIILQCPDVPKTKSGKVVEIAVRMLLNGEEVNNLESIANPECLKYFRNIGKA